MKKSVAMPRASMPALPCLNSEDVMPQLFYYSPNLGQMSEYAVQTVNHLAAGLRQAGILSRKEIRNLRQAAVWQDAGMLLIPREVLLKSAPFTLEEMCLIQSHVELSCRLAAKAGVNVETLDIIAAHHEQVNGGGYPRGLRGDEISLCAQLLRLANDYCLLQIDLPGRLGVRSCCALQVMAKQKGKKYSPKVFEEIFLPALGDLDLGV